jgi:hypothetical protein
MDADRLASLDLGIQRIDPGIELTVELGAWLVGKEV